MNNPDLLDPDTPDDVVVRDHLRVTTRSTTAETELAVGHQPFPDRTPRHRLVAIGDSISHGLTSGAVFRTDRSFPAVVAEALECTFDIPHYAGPLDGLPLNIEALSHRLIGTRSTLGWRHIPGMTWRLWRAINANEDYWERGGGRTNASRQRYHNVAIYGWDLRDSLSVRHDTVRERASAPTHDHFAQVKPEHDNDIAAASVLAGFDGAATQLDAATELGRDGGIDTLIVELGANNALPTVTSKRVRWSGDDYQKPGSKSRYTVWRPTHFEHEYRALADRLGEIDARRVVLVTVPHVTIAPFAKGINPDQPGHKLREDSRYFPLYVDPWIPERHIDRHKVRHLTHQQARAIDAAIDQYNDTIQDVVRRARLGGRDWCLFDLCHLLDRLAFRRYVTSPETAERNGIQPYQLQDGIAALDTRWFSSDRSGRTAGGLFGLDGIHPTITGNAVIARELLWTLQSVGAASSPASIDLDAALRVDSLNSHPPKSLDRLVELVAPFARHFVSRIPKSDRTSKGT